MTAGHRKHCNLNIFRRYQFSATLFWLCTSYHSGPSKVECEKSCTVWSTVNPHILTIVTNRLIEPPLFPHGKQYTFQHFFNFIFELKIKKVRSEEM